MGSDFANRVAQWVMYSLLVTLMNIAEINILLNIKESTIISQTLLLINIVTVCWRQLCSVLNIVYW